MANHKNGPGERPHGNLITILASNPEEVNGFVKAQTDEAQKIRLARFPTGEDRAIRDNLVTIFRTLPTGKVDIRAIALAKMGGVTGFQVPPNGTEVEISYKGVNAEFDRAIEARHVEGFIAEHTFLVSCTALTALSRRAILEVVSLDDSLHFATTTTILEDTITALIALRDKIPNFVPTKKRKGIVVPGDTLNHNTSIEFLTEAIASSLKNNIQMVEGMERAVKGALKKAASQTTTQTLRNDERFKILWDFLDKILQILASLRPSTKNMLPTGPVIDNLEELPEPINTTATVLDLMKTALGALLVQLHANPALFLSQNLKGLSEVASSARDAQKSGTTT